MPFIEIGWSRGRIWGFQTDSRHIWRGRKCSLPRRTRSAAALSLPKRERKVRADTCFAEIIFLIVRIRFCTRSAGTLTKFCCVRNSIPMKVNFWAGKRSDFLRFGRKPRLWIVWMQIFVWVIRRLWIRFFISQSSRYGKTDMARWCRNAAITSISFEKINGLRDIPNGRAEKWYTWSSCTKRRYFLDWWCIGTCRYASVKSMETAQSLSLIACLTDLTVSILNACFSM